MSRSRILQSLDDGALYQQLKALYDGMPNLEDDTEDVMRWLGRLHALVGETGNVVDQVKLINATARVRHTHYGPPSRAEVKSILFRALAQAEINAPSSAQGTFIAAGSAFDAFAAVGKILAEARGDILIIDPYMDASVLTDFAKLAPEGVPLRLLTDQGTVKETLLPAVARWVEQYGDGRPLQARLAAPRSLHDRSILIDRESAWISTQSFKDLAAKAPASLSKLNGDAGQMKIAAYEEIWNVSVVIP